MLSPEHQKILQVAIIDYLQGMGGSLTTLVGIEVAGQLPVSATASSHATDIIRLAARDIELLRKVIGTVDPLEISADLQPVRLWTDNWAPPTPASLFAVLELLDGRPFVDRDSLRGELRNLLTPDSRQVLLINGADGLGKSYSARLIEEQADQHADFRVAKLKAESSSASIWGIEDVALEIIRPLSGQTSRKPTHVANSDRLAGLLADWTADEVRRSGDTLWIVLDGFGHIDIPRETGKYLDELITLSVSDERMKRTRLILFDFEAQRLASLTDAYSSVVLHMPNADELEEYFKARFPDLPDYYWQEGASIAMRKIPPDGPGRMLKLQLNVQRANDVLKQ